MSNIDEKAKVASFYYDLEELIGLKIKTAVIENNLRLNYFRGKDLKQLCEQNKHLIIAKYSELGYPVSEKNYIQEFHEKIIKLDFLIKAKKLPNDKLKYPTKLVPDNNDTNRSLFEEDKYYFILFVN